MRTIGIISDTHGLLRPEALNALRGCELILHAGDVGGLEILKQLEAIAPLHAVYGNTDWGEVRVTLPGTAMVDLGAPDGRLAESGPVGPLAYVLHDLVELDLDPAAAGVRLVVTGHTHEPEIRESGGVMYLNPGSAGPRRFRLPITVSRLTVEEGQLDAAIVHLNID